MTVKLKDTWHSPSPSFVKLSMMRIPQSVFVSSVAVMASFSPAFGTTAEDVLSQMDQAAPKFSGMSADLTRVTYTKVIDEKATETGTMLLRRGGPRDLNIVINFTTPDPKTVLFRGRKAEIYYPKMKTIEEWDLGKHTDLVNQFLVLGFGATGRELKTNYSVKYGAEEMISGEKANRLDLTPISAQTRQNIARVELWVAEKGAYPLQQRVVKPSGDYYLFTYSNVKLNPPMSDDELRLKPPKGTKRVFPQK